VDAVTACGGCAHSDPVPETKNTTDVFQLWIRHGGLGSGAVTVLNALFGLVMIVSGKVVAPQIIRSCGSCRFTSLALAAQALAFTLWGCATSPSVKTRPSLSHPRLIGSVAGAAGSFPRVAGARHANCTRLGRSTPGTFTPRQPACQRSKSQCASAQNNSCERRSLSSGGSGCLVLCFAQANVLGCGLVLLLPAINATSKNALLAAATAHATSAEHSFGRGQFHGMFNNLRAINQALVPVVVGRCYAALGA
jgi:hypothetical protein